MLTDEELTSELTLAFGDATDGVEPAAGLLATVHRQHRTARRRVTALRIAVPAAVVACVGGAAFATGWSGTSAPKPPAATGSGLSHTSHSPKVRTAAYVLKLPTDAGSSFGCIDASDAHVMPDSGVWYVAVGSNCTALVVDTDTTLPADARPIELDGIPGLYGTTDETSNMRTIYSQNPDGSWSALTVSTSASDQALRGFYTPVG